MIPGIIKPLSSLVKEQELSRIAHCENNRHYKGAYRAQPIFRSKGVQIWLPTTWIQRGPIQAIAQLSPSFG